MKVLGEVSCIITARVPHEEMDRCLQMLNTHHAGKPQIPLDEEVSEAHKDSHFQIRRTLSETVTLQILEDGTFRIKELEQV